MDLKKDSERTGSSPVLEGDTERTYDDDNEDYVEEMFALLQQDSGLKPQEPEIALRLHNKLEEVLGDEPRNCKVGKVHVDVQLARDKDQKLPHRAELADEVRDTVEETLSEHVTPNGDLRLHVRVLLVSDGASVASRRFTSGVGTAKVTLAYCLLSDESKAQEVALADIVYHKQPCEALDLDNYWESSSAVVRSLARIAAQHVFSEVTFHLVQWKNHCKENHDRLEKIEGKLANAESLNADEYAFAAEKHIL